MWSTIRAMLVWMIVLAMPVQGFAAAGMLHCVAGHGAAGAVSASTAGDPGARSAPPEPRPGAHAHHAADTPMGHGHHDTMHASVSQVDDPVSSAHACSACAVCCAVVALPGGIRMTLEPEGRFFGPPGSPGAAPSFVPSGLERPPRVHPA
jgi:hypothetical protein